MAPPASRPSPAFSGEAPPLRLRASPPCRRLLPSCARQPGRICEMPCGPPVLFFFFWRGSLGGAGTIWQPLTWCYSLSVHSFSQLPECVSVCSVCLRAVRVFVSLYVRLCDVECVYS